MIVDVPNKPIMNYAPIVLFCYNRPQHLRQTLDALLQNQLAKESELIVFSDGPKNDSELDSITAVRNIIKELTGFKSVQINIQDNNRGLAQTIICGLTEVFQKYNNAIIMEDDLICSSDFLNFMNEGLAVYEMNKHVFSISGYSFGIKVPEDYKEDVALVFRASSWGWGTWANRWEKVDWEITDFEEFQKDKVWINRLKNAGEDIYPMIVKQQRGIIQSWAVRWTYHHVKYNGYCLIPIKSKVRNIGTDGSGTNFTERTHKYDLKIYNQDISINSYIQPNAEIIQFIRTNNKPSLLRRIINRLKLGIW
ncbi:MAG: glycosyltransferase [Chitinophagales bacterium]|nr:glycosyltransferase [Chitinophagales bacterium]